MSRIIWHGEQLKSQVNKGRRKALRNCGRIVARKAKALCPIDVEEKFVAGGGNIFAGVLVGGAHGGKDWTARVPGTLKKSIRYKIVKKGTKVQVIAGNRLAYYAMWVEFGTHKAMARPLIRPALEQSTTDIVAQFNDWIPKT